MDLFKRIWNDDAGVIMATEAVAVGTVAVIGLTAGLATVSTAVNEELKDVAFAIRSLDQSYCVPAQKGCGAWTAGSSFRQEPVERSLKELNEVMRDAEKQEKTQSERLRYQLERQQHEEIREGDEVRQKSDNEIDDDNSKKDRAVI